MFPISIEGQFELPQGDFAHVDAALTSMQDALTAVRASTVSRDGNAVTYTASLWRFVTNWNILAPVPTGRIEIQPGMPGVVTFRFSTILLLMLGTAGATFIAAAAGQDGHLGFGLVVFAVGWLWLFGMNYLIAYLRLRAFVRRSVLE